MVFDDRDRERMVRSDDPLTRAMAPPPNETCVPSPSCLYSCLQLDADVFCFCLFFMFSLPGCGFWVLSPRLFIAAFSTMDGIDVEIVALGC